MNPQRHYASQPALRLSEKHAAVMRAAIAGVPVIIRSKADNRWLDDANVREVE